MNALQRIAADAPATVLVEAIRNGASGTRIAVVDPVLEHAATDAILQAIAAGLDGAGVASASPVPVRAEAPVLYPVHALLPPAPTLAVPCRRLCVFDVDAASSLGGARPVSGSVADQLTALSIQLLQYGWRHVAAPGVALAWDPTTIPTTIGAVADVAAWTPSSAAELVGAANVGLETHTTWATSQVNGLRVVIDGACLDGESHTGTQHLVLEVARQMKLARPDATVMLAVPRKSIEPLRASIGRAGVDLVERSSSIDADVMYRPYQMLRVDELDAVMRVGRRRLVGQLDMIGFSNPFYHPSPSLFSFARNLQRHMMRGCDGVAFISDYGRDAAVAECPDLSPSRLHVVSCGADPVPSAEATPPVPALIGEPFLLCLSATFFHKNRAHAIATFGELVSSTGYRGSLVIAGPEPFYGRSNEDDDELVLRLPVEVRRRVVRLGQASEAEKWWLLRHAQAVLYPSILEGFGLIPFEAAAAGTPCLAYAGTGPGELLGGTPATIQTWDPAAWAARLAEWIERPAEAETATHAVCDLASSYTWRRCAERTWAAIDATLAQPSNSHPAEEGGPLASVRSAPRSATLRFNAARIQHALARRVRSRVDTRRRES